MAAEDITHKLEEYVPQEPTPLPPPPHDWVIILTLTIGCCVLTAFLILFLLIALV